MEAVERGPFLSVLLPCALQYIVEVSSTTRYLTDFCMSFDRNTRREQQFRDTNSLRARVVVQRRVGARELSLRRALPFDTASGVQHLRELRRQAVLARSRADYQADFIDRVRFLYLLPTTSVIIIVPD